MRDLYFTTLAVQSKYDPSDTVASLRAILEADPDFGPVSETQHETESSVYTKLEAQYSMNGETAERYYQTHGCQWPLLRFFVNVKRESNTAVVYAKSAGMLPQTLCNAAQRKAEAIIDAAKVSDQELTTKFNVKALIGVCAGLLAFIAVMAMFM